ARTSASSACAASASATSPSAGTCPASARRPGEGGAMTVSDPVADLLARVRNALAARHEKTDVPSSRFKVELARILKDEGYIKNYKVLDDRGVGLLRLYLKYDASGNPVIHGLTRSSRPGRRYYARKDTLPEVLGGL